jgi:preprotein translocase subunit YajC
MRALVSWLPILLIAVVFWLLIIRPAQRRQSATLMMQKSVEPGDDVVLTSGIYGRVVEITDDHVGVEVAEGVTLRVLRGAIGSKVHKDESPDDPADPAVPADPTHTTDDTAVVDGED